MAEISDMDWAQHIMMDYAQNLKKDPTKAKKITFTRFAGRNVFFETAFKRQKKTESFNEIITWLGFRLISYKFCFRNIGIAKIA